jgi:hypothetical protein
MATSTLRSEIAATFLGPSPRAVALLRISREEVFGSMMDVAPVPDLTASLALVDAQTTSEGGHIPTTVTAPSHRAEGERAPRPRPGLC